jgi:hypothetical protein
MIPLKPVLKATDVALFTTVPRRRLLRLPEYFSLQPAYDATSGVREDSLSGLLSTEPRGKCAPQQCLGNERGLELSD